MAVIQSQLERVFVLRPFKVTVEGLPPTNLVCASIVLRLMQVAVVHRGKQLV